MTQLLVSVRSAEEAEAALRGGAALIDVKEPGRGSLGRASDGVIADVLRTVAGRRPVSAALGELLEPCREIWPPEGMALSFVKWGLAGYGRRDHAVWRSELCLALRGLTELQPPCGTVAVAYADWRRAHSPPPEEVCSFAVDHAMAAFLIDTWQKDGSTLLNWMDLDVIGNLTARCQSAAIPVALAGSLGPAEIETLLPLRAAWIAVRGAACQARRREAAIDEGKVRQLAALLAQKS